MMNDALVTSVKDAVRQIYGMDCSPVLETTKEIFGDYSTNIALQLSAKLSISPGEIAQSIAESLGDDSMIAEVNVAGPGFINIRLTPETHAKVVEDILEKGESYGLNEKLQGMTVVAEYSDPNPFKVLHAGHLYTSLVGDSISNLLEAAGAKVHRVNFGGDVGLHVAKSMWAILKNLGGELSERLDSIAAPERLDWISSRYVEGNEVYEEDTEAKAEIIKLNKRVYEIHSTNDRDSQFAKIYWTCRQWSYEGFNALYQKLEMNPFEKYYPESETTPLGLSAVKDHLSDGIFEESEGAVVYRGENEGLHTRVFITSEGLPTYEAKDLGLALSKWEEYSFDQNIMITGNDIIEYMKVVQSAVRKIHPEIAERSKHITHGIVKLAGGVKMSSRKGNILRADDILDAAMTAYKNATDSDNWSSVLAAVKYAFLKQRIGGDIVYNPDDSVSITGNSGPYLQYAHARAKSILVKSELGDSYIPLKSEIGLLKKLQEYEGVVNKSIEELMPHHIANYLFELAQEFNSFYEKERIVGNARESELARLISAYVQVLRNGLKILGIQAPDRM